MSNINNINNIFNGINNKEDLNILLNNINYDNKIKLFYNNINSISNNKIFLSYNDFQQFLIYCSQLKYKEDIYEYIYKINNKLSQTQLNTLTRIIKNKPSNNYTRDITKIKNKKHYLLKKCPHCNHENKIFENNNYSICGYNDISLGYDWEGCGKDWCTLCSKKLCKNWFDNQLFIEENRIHNSKCCLEHSIKNKLNYQYEYCQCNNN